MRSTDWVGLLKENRGIKTTSINNTCCLSKKMKQILSFSFIKLEFTISKELCSYSMHYYKTNQPKSINHSTSRLLVSLWALLVYKEKVSLTSWPMRSRLSRKYFTDSPCGKGKRWQLSLFLGQQVQPSDSVLASQQAPSSNTAISRVEAILQQSLLEKSRLSRDLNKWSNISTKTLKWKGSVIKISPSA